MVNDQNAALTTTIAGVFSGAFASRNKKTANQNQTVVVIVFVGILWSTTVAFPRAAKFNNLWCILEVLKKCIDDHKCDYGHSINDEHMKHCRLDARHDPYAHTNGDILPNWNLRFRVFFFTPDCECELPEKREKCYKMLHRMRTLWNLAYSHFRVDFARSKRETRTISFWLVVLVADSIFFGQTSTENEQTTTDRVISKVWNDVRSVSANQCKKNRCVECGYNIRTNL